jgi:ABC-2 type transport system ATP-binding protein
MTYTETLAPAIRVARLTKRWGDHVVLDGLDLTVPAGTVYALLGPNGAGKSTLIRILTTLTRPNEGVAIVGGHDVTAAPAEVRRAISVTGQTTAVDELLTGRENLRMVARIAGLPRRAARARADDLLEQVDLLDAADVRAKSYSGGMRRRLDLAASLVVVPAVLFLDEPTTGLDTRSRQTLWRRIEELAAGGTTIFLTTQYLEEADELADRIGVLDGGRLVAEGTAPELKARVGTDVLELTIACDAQREVATHALSATAAGPDSIHVPTDASSGHVRRVLDALAADGITDVRVAVRAPTLDDVFLSFVTERTGPSAAGAQQPAPVVGSHTTTSERPGPIATRAQRSGRVVDTRTTSEVAS